MKAQELYQQGFDLGRKGQYKEAVEAFTQAINLNPDFVEAYNLPCLCSDWNWRPTWGS
ncbi:tetratricopeptide repeat protein [Microcoleus sp. AT3-D2]|uniref:tetratricopeptide repeat protein n=1 Tax=Microcoleus sp. AT3-D2 TaxID=2818612 RepID=UPI002FD39018